MSLVTSFLFYEIFICLKSLQQRGTLHIERALAAASICARFERAMHQLQS
jgi:hypothetical protein